MRYNLRGGQGRDLGDLSDSASALLWCAAISIAAVLIFLLAGCCTYRERDGVLSPNTPSRSDLREICPM